MHNCLLALSDLKIWAILKVCNYSNLRFLASQNWPKSQVIITFKRFCLDLDHCNNFLFLIGGTLGVICVAFFMQGSGIFWSGNTSEPWIILGNNLLGLLTIYLWAGLWSTLIFGSLYAANILRVDRETEFRGSDLVRDLRNRYYRAQWSM